MGKFLKQGYVRRLEWEHSRGEISYSKMIELIEQECIKNYKAQEQLVNTMNKNHKTDESVQQQEVMSPVEYLAERYNYITWLRNRDEISPATADQLREKFLKQAKEMERQQTDKTMTIEEALEILHYHKLILEQQHLLREGEEKEEIEPKDLIEAITKATEVLTSTLLESGKYDG